MPEKRHFTDALETCVRLVRDDPRVKGMLVSGSYVTGRMGPYSDLDVFLLVGDEEEYLPKWETRTIGSVELEIVAHTFTEYGEAIARKVAIKQAIHPLAVGEVVFDRDGRLASLKSRAQAVVRELSARVEPSAAVMKELVRPLTFGFRKIGNAYSRQEWDFFHYEYGLLLHVVPDMVVRMRGYQLCAFPLHTLQRELPDLYLLVRRCLTSNAPAEKWPRLIELMQAVFTEFGLGELPRAVSDDAIAVKPPASLSGR